MSPGTADCEVLILQVVVRSAEVGALSLLGGGVLTWEACRQTSVPTLLGVMAASSYKIAIIILLHWDSGKIC